MDFSNLDLERYSSELKYFTRYYGADFREGQGTEELLDMVNKYSIDGNLIDLGSGSNIYFWLLAMKNITNVKCVDICREAFYINEQIRLGIFNGKSFKYPEQKYRKNLDEVKKIPVEYYIDNLLKDGAKFSYKSNMVSQFGLLGLSKTEDEYIENFGRLYNYLEKDGIFLGANWYFSDSYANEVQGFKNDYLSCELVDKLAEKYNGEVLYSKLVPIKDDPNYNYVLIYTIKKK